MPPLPMWRSKIVKSSETISVDNPLKKESWQIKKTDTDQELLLYRTRKKLALK